MRGCLVYTERAPRQQQFHVAPAMQQLKSSLVTSVDIQNALCRATVTHCLELSGSSLKQRMMSVSIAKALGTHLKTKRSTGVHIKYNHNEQRETDRSRKLYFTRTVV